MQRESDPKYPEGLQKFAPWIAAAIVLVAGGPSLYCLIPHYMGLTDAGPSIAVSWVVVWSAVVPAISFLIAHVIAGVGNVTTPRPAGSSLNSPWSGSAMVLLGVVLPMMAMIVLVPGLASLGFREDPAFTLWHVLLIALIPIGILVSWEAVAMGRVTQAFIVGPLMGAALAVSATYALVALSIFERIAPLLLVDPRALMILTPPLAFVCAIFVYRKVRVLGDPTVLLRVNKFVILGFALSLGALFFPEAAPGFTRDGIADATAKSSKQRHAGVRLLRGMGLDETVLRYCYREIIPPIALSEYLPGHGAGRRPKVQTSDARAVYYRVTGQPFNTVTRPGQWGGLWLRWSDTDVAGEQVGAKADGLSLANSSMEGSLDADTGVGYLEWTLAFANASERGQEARALVELPPGAVVSRVTLFVDGKPREALYNNRALTRKAYQVAVQSLQDPLLVTQVAPDRVLVQCFPVPAFAQGDALKVLLGISMPLAAANDTTRVVKLPRIVENNFTTTGDHNFKLTSLQPVAAGNIATKQSSAPGGVPVTIEGQVSDGQLLASGRALDISAKAAANKSSGAGKSAKSAPAKPSAKSAQGWQSPSRLFVVIDGSQVMTKHLPALAKALNAVPKGIKTEVLFASDEITELSPDGEVPVEQSLDKALKDIPILPCRGGPDNTPALFRAWQRACAEKGTAVLWVHGPQPTLFDHPDNVVTSFRDEIHNNQMPRLYEIEVEPGANKLVEAIESASAGSANPLHFRNVPRLSNLTDDLTALFGSWSGQAGLSFPKFDSSMLGPQRVWAAQPKLASAMRSLCAHQLVAQLLDAGKPAEAGVIASEQRIVSPVTGAVVVAVPENWSPGQGTLNLSPSLQKITAPPLVAPEVDTGIFKEKPIDRPQVVIPPPVKSSKIDTSRTHTQAPFKLPDYHSGSLRTTQPSRSRSYQTTEPPSRVGSYGGSYRSYASPMHARTDSNAGWGGVRPMSIGGGRRSTRPSQSSNRFMGSGTESIDTRGTLLADRGMAPPVAVAGSAGSAGGGPPDAMSAGDVGGYFKDHSPMMQGATSGVIGPQSDSAVPQGVNTSGAAATTTRENDEALMSVFGASSHSDALKSQPSEQLSLMLWVVRIAVFCAVLALLVLMILPVLKPKRTDR